jgi:DNA repair exonuclease SbcCD ATPase subunit
VFSDPVKLVGGIIALITFVGVVAAAFVTLRSNILRQTISDQKLRIDNLEGTLHDRDRQVSELGQKVKLAESETELLKERLSHLEEIVSGRIDFSAISTEISHHHAEMCKRQDDQHKETLRALRDVKSMLAARRTGDAEGAP